MQTTGIRREREKAVLVRLSPLAGHRDREAELEELARLVDSAGANVVAMLTQRRRLPDPATFVGAGKARQIAEVCGLHGADLVCFDHDLSPTQIRNLEKSIDRRVLDRTELILDIFATRARTYQAKLQVELAQLEYTLPRLMGMWSHLHRLAGGVGIGTRGPGEKQIEVDRRIARRQIHALRRQLRTIEGRKRRMVDARSDEFTVGLVGYTNAGKSTLMNRLARTRVAVEDRLFSTLDTKTHLWKLSDRQNVLLSDTVGFLRDLPHHLVASFHATLEEVTRARLLLLVADASARQLDERLEAVLSVLTELGADCIPRILVLNKADLLRDRLDAEIVLRRHPDAILVSAAKGEGIEELDRAVRRVVAALQVETDLEVPVSDGRTLAFLEREGTVLSRECVGETMRVRVRLAERNLRLVPAAYFCSKTRSLSE